MFCDECAPAARQAKKKEYKKRAREKKRALVALQEAKTHDVHFCDSPERIELCLSCTKQKCIGYCEALRSLKVKR